MAASIQVQTVTENPDGRVLVQAKAPASRENDGRPIAGYYFRRRYEGEKFLIARPEEFSPTWMRFVDRPPQSWTKTLSERFKDVDLADLMVTEPKTRRQILEEEDAQFAMSEIVDSPRNEMDYGNGRVVPRKPGRPRKNNLGV